MARRLPLAAVVAIAGTIAGWASVYFVYERGESFGIDFGVFHSAGALIRTSGYEAAYDPEVFSPFFVENYYPDLAGQRTVSHFISPPPFGWLMQPVSSLPYWTSLWVSLALGVLVLVPAVKLLRLPMLWVPILALSPAMVTNVRLGQLGPFILLVMIGVHVASSRDQPLRAGLVAGLFLLKPTLAFGYGLWWLIDAAKWKVAIAASAVSGALLAVPTLVGGFDPWRGFIDAMRFRVDTEGQWKQQSMSLPEFLKLLAPRSPGAVTLVFWALGILAAAAMLLAARRRVGSDSEVMSAVAVVATVVASPHLLVYDGFILIIPVAVAWHRGVLDSSRLQLLAAIHVGSIVFGPGIYEWQFGVFGRGVAFEFPGLILCSVLLVRWWNEDRELPNESPAASAPVVANH